MDEEFLMTISPFVRRARIMETENFSGGWMDYDHCFTGIIDGEADFYVNSDKFHLSKGDIIIIPPMCKHMIASTSETPLQQYIFHFDFFYYKSRSNFPEMMSIDEFIAKNYTIPEKENIMNRKPLVAHLQTQDLLEFQTSFLHLLNEFKDKPPLYQIRMKYLCIKLLVLCLRHQEETEAIVVDSSPKVRMNIQRAIEYIHRNYDNPELNNDMIAAEIGVSSKYLSQIFRDEMGIQIHKYLNHVRIEAAQKLAVLGTMNITEIAYSVGYRSIHTFSKVFKKITDMSPSEFLHTNITHVEDIYIKWKWDDFEEKKQ